ncbi:Hypothetical predicted protein [Mytilus galloprovincialis]|uniref:Uncharacterized protein n=1 Tax=Mytilus galloprovincialis TaxID=29158 RepID=A0A8B6CE10_MYTGA|nr:Hypothetical predicted protein [Mytilus galloprovincialis]
MGITEKYNNKTSFSMTPEEFTKIFETSYQEALENIMNSPFRNSSRSKHGKGILAITLYYATSQQTNTQLSEELAPVFANLFEKVESDCNTDLNTSEKLFSSFYKITVDNEFQSKLSAIVTSEFENIDFEGELSAKLFLSVLQDALLKSLVKNRAQLYQKNATKLDTTMTNSDQSVLYYISGYIISKLQKKTYQHKNLKNQKIREAMTNFVVKQSTMLQEHVKKFAEWTEKLNRGGLKIPSDNFYYFIRHCEIVLRQSIDLGNVNSQTLMITNLKEVIVSAHMVNYYWEILCDNNEFSSYIMESCVSLFLTIRGHSLARAVQLQMPNSTSQHEKPLRKVLKDKADNRKQ